MEITNLKEMKTWLKENGKAIRALKLEIKESMRANNGCGGLQWTHEIMKDKYRNNHIAYSMARGKTYEQIESYTRPDTTTPNWSYINDLIFMIEPEKEIS